VQSFWDFFWFMFWFFLWIMWLMLLFRVFIDVFRSDQSGWAKAGWTIFVLVLPFLGVLVYLIAQGGNMARRNLAAADAMEQSRRDYIRRSVGSGSVADELEKLASLRERDVISQEEFEAQKARLMG
jgi:hypothetical protein